MTTGILIAAAVLVAVVIAAVWGRLLSKRLTTPVTTPKKPVTTPKPRTTAMPAAYRFYCPRCKKQTLHKFLGYGNLGDGVMRPGYSCEENNCFHELILYPYRDYSKPGHPLKGAR